ncbi:MULTISPECIES: LytR C-terminal domain-containing protein [unclassified Actinomyces]|uniref:LytR C-terminal domain-containing protein n=1 Tax=unclassified Actinomyces TaxID=2609248 RepID=UPI0013A70752|nr:LytR C-terminal domain-containing protein [Actinomyces sp. 594]MBW3069203.1 LytR C-terminal domain-containing protein [Actinomyces sp. 594]NDR53387.1 LytR C-terminal domain-containing protein [Actinomyces sp. 565]
MSRYDYPDDEFDADDDGPVPVGVHRAQVPAWRSWIPLLAILIIVPLLAWGVVGLLGRHATGGRESTAAASGGAATAQASADGQRGAPEASAEASSEASAEATGSTDFTTGITVHNGTDTTGLATRTGDKLGNVGFTSVTVSQGVYTMEEPTVTTIYYASAELAATAQAVADALGSGEVVESAEEAQSNPIVVVLRSDYQE